jgi:hypothetical protein
MIKALTIILILIIFNTFITTASAEPPAQIIIRSEEELAEMRRMVYASDEILIDYLNRTAHSWNGITNREEVIKFLNFIDSLPIPYIKGTRFSAIVCYMEDKNTHIFFLSEAGEIHSYLFYPIDIWFGVADAEKKINDFFEGYNRLNFYTSLESQDFELNENGGIAFAMEIDGFVVSIRYGRGNNEDITTFNPQEVYKDMVVTSFREAPWSTISVTFTTTDALTILCAVAGMVTLTDAQIARYGISGTPATANAMRILRVVAGL